MASLKTNYLLNLINTVAGMLFPIITFPYAARILESDGIGVINFYNSIITYISLFTCLGIPLYATREIAKMKHNPEQLSKTSSQILVLHVILTLIGYIAVVILVFSVPKIRDNYPIFLILSASLIFTAMGCDWYFRGTEDFKYITIRGLICRIIYIPLLFIFVKTKSDLLIYAGLTVFVTVGNNCFNFYRISNVLKLKELKDALNQPFKHLKGSIKIFMMSASISLYVQLNLIILGFLSTTTAVGYYTAASRVSVIVAGVVGALQTTLLPRSVSLLSQNNEAAFNATLSKVLNFIFFISLPMSAGLIVMAPLVIRLFAGETYYPAITTLEILAVNFVFALFANFINSGFLIPQGKENITTYACLIAGVVNIILNFSLIPTLSQNGTAIAAVATEIIVATSLIILGRKYIKIRLWNNSFLKYIVASILMFLLCKFLWDIDSFEAFRLVVIPLAGIIFYFSLLYLLRDSLVKEIQGLVISKIRRIVN